MKAIIRYILKPLALALGYSILWVCVIAAVCYPSVWVILAAIVVVMLSAAGMAKLYPKGL